jgi:hypothetical protein
MLKALVKKASNYAGLEIVRSNSADFRWSHTVEDYNPITPKPRWHKGHVTHANLCQILDRNRVEYEVFLDVLLNNANLLHGIAYDPENEHSDLPFWNNQLFRPLMQGLLSPLLPGRHLRIT